MAEGQAAVKLFDVPNLDVMTFDDLKELDYVLKTLLRYRCLILDERHYREDGYACLAAGREGEAKVYARWAEEKKNEARYLYNLLPEWARWSKQEVTK